MPTSDKNWYRGVLYEISPFGTGLIEESKTGRVYGFHKCMLPSTGNLALMEGATIRFQLNASGAVQTIDLLAV